MANPPLVPRPAATVILLRDSADGPEVFMMQRTHKASFVPGGYVFPGGAVDPADRHPDLLARSDGPDDHTASAQLGIAEGGLAYWVAAVRECFEESGLLLARAPQQTHTLMAGGLDDFSPLRQRLAAGELDWPALCVEQDWRLALDALHYLSHWITPVGTPRRFDTRFFLARAPENQQAAHDNAETIDHLWIRPDKMLERHRSGEATVMFATVKTLELLASFADVDAALAYVRAPREIPAITPRATVRDGKRQVIVPGHPAWAEVCRLDPEGRGDVSSELVPGVVTALSPQVRRIAAPNPGFMTGPGTNSYLLGAADSDALALIDPGPDIDIHAERLLDAAAGRLRWILTTHTHMDHSPLAQRLRRDTGAQVIGMPAPPHGNQDRDFRPDHVPQDGELLALGGLRLRAIHTPGHASNHLCFLLEDEKLLFTGDHVMQGSTVVINPPDGDMATYLASLQKLKAFEIDHFAPAHGFLMAQPHRIIDRITAHRLQREARVLSALHEGGAQGVDELLLRVYDDVPPQRHGMARRSLLAHLVKLRDERRALETDGLWCAA